MVYAWRHYHDRRRVGGSQTCSWSSRKICAEHSGQKIKSDNVLLRIVSCSQICSQCLNYRDADISCICNDRYACQQESRVEACQHCPMRHFTPSRRDDSKALGDCPYSASLRVLRQAYRGHVKRLIVTGLMSTVHCRTRMSTSHRCDRYIEHCH